MCLPIGNKLEWEAKLLKSFWANYIADKKFKSESKIWVEFWVDRKIGMWVDSTAVFGEILFKVLVEINWE